MSHVVCVAPVLGNLNLAPNFEYDPLQPQPQILAQRPPNNTLKVHPSHSFPLPLAVPL